MAAHESARACSAAVTLAMSTGHSARQVFDLPEPTPLVVTEHRAPDCRCAACGTHSRAGFPLSVNAPVQYGIWPEDSRVVIYLLHYKIARST
jgi:transposase